MACPNSCKFGKECLQKLTVGQVCQFRKRYWGGPYEAAPKDKDRKQKSIDILKDCYDVFNKTFNFRILKIDGENFDQVCEGAFLVALGKQENMQLSQVSFSP